MMPVGILAVVPQSAMTSVFVNYMRPILVKEGGSSYTNDPTDRGGPTKYGITEARARSAGFDGDMRDLTLDQAMTIYWKFFWLQPQLDKVFAVMPTVAASMLDLGINFGTGKPGLWLQQILNVLNNQAALWPDLTEDGSVGMMTIGGLTALKKGRGPDADRVVDAAMHALAFEKYFEIMRGDPTQEKYGWGWISQRAFPRPAGSANV